MSCCASSTCPRRSVAPRRFHGIWRGIPLNECVGGNCKYLDNLTPERWATVALDKSQLHFVERNGVYHGFMEAVPGTLGKDTYATVTFGAPDVRKIYREWYAEATRTMPSDWKGFVVSSTTDLNNAGSNSGKLNDVIKVWRDKIDAPVIRADAIDKNTGRVIGKVLQLAEEAITAAAPEYSQGKRVYQARTSMSVDPLNQGPVGKVAGVGFEPDKAATLPRVLSELGGDAATPQRIRTLATELRAKDPQAFPNIARAYLEQEFGKAFSDVQAGANRMSGANFRKNIFGNDAQRANLKTMIEEVASAQGQNPREVWSGFQKMLDVFEATGRTPGIGSQTDIRGEMGRMSRQSKAAGALEVVSTTPTASVAGWWRDVVSRGAYRELADVFTSPDAIAQMRKLAKMRTGSSASTQAVAAIIGSTSGKGAEQQENAGP